MSDIAHWGSAQDRADLDRHITRGDDPDDEEDEQAAAPMPRSGHPCALPPLPEPGPTWRCAVCGAQWRCVALQPGMRRGVWHRTYAEQKDAP